MERKLREPVRATLRAVRCNRDGFRPQTRTLRVVHLLRAEAFFVHVVHPDIRVAEKFRAELKELDEDHGIFSFSGLTCTEAQRVGIHVNYDAVRHEREVLLVLASQEDDGPAYCATFRPVLHESHEVRMGFMAETARRVVLGHCKSWLKEDGDSRVEDLKSEDCVAPIERGHDTAFLMIASQIGRLPVPERRLLTEYHIDGLSWAEIADRREITEDAARKTHSRLMQRIAERMLNDKAVTTKDTMHRVVKWMKEMLPRVLERE